ncbi:hypothetical protein X777_13565 [Ooceraea biroi]|uniref:Uncharacterized protein n=1 Tax=Ooceraea biroi TaxID=2015173 RepID=A0A026WXK9_OOCBI|nr:hypothetical protein X777_13565 [Ooceraea biroi]
MLKIMLLLSAFGHILCEMQTRSEATIGRIPSCRNPPLCHLSDTYRTASESISPLLPYQKSVSYGRQGSNLQRSYVGFGSSTSPAYYHAFDPISVLASLAFLAFLLQSFASFYEHSRSILPTIVSSRHSSSDLTIPDISRHVSNALQEYVSISGCTTKYERDNGTM